LAVAEVIEVNSVSAFEPGTAPGRPDEKNAAAHAERGGSAAGRPFVNRSPGPVSVRNEFVVVPLLGTKTLRTAVKVVIGWVEFDIINSTSSDG
jgi:hypothetical protein